MKFLNKKQSDKKEAPVKKRVNRKPRKTVEVIVAVCVAVFVILAAAVTILLVYKPDYSDDPPSFITNDPANTDTPAVSIVVTDSEGNQGEIVRNQEQVNFLILGKDRWAFNTDVMIIASYNVTEGSISMMQIPRDTYIDIGRGNHKANSLLASFYNEAIRSKEADPLKAALENFKKALEQIFCITIDYYAMMDLNGFVNIVDAIGGVEIDVPFRMYYWDPAQNLKIDLKAGLQTLDGNKAEQFIRFRADYVEGDIGRVDAQKLFISACLSKVKSNFSISTISAIAEQVMQHVTTDIPLQDVVYYAKKALSVDLDKMTMLTIPGIQGRQYESSGTWYYIVYRDGTISAINKYFNPYNFDVTSELFDRNHALYDEPDTYMHSVFLTEQKKEESYTADNTGDIHISKYPTKPVTTATTAIPVPETTPTETTASNLPTETTATAESGVHTETAELTGEPETTTDVPVESTNAPDEQDPEETTVIEVTEELVEPEETKEPTEATELLETTALPDDESLEE